MQIKHEDIVIKQKNPSLITQKELQEDNELIRKFIELSLSILEMKFGQPNSLAIRRDIEEELTINFIKELGGNKNAPSFIHIVNANTVNDYKITMLISVQKKEETRNGISFADKIKNIFRVK